MAEMTLHVGYGTFEPVRVEDIRQHQVEAEVFEIDSGSARLINNARQQGGRVIAVGTTTTRALESAAKRRRRRRSTERPDKSDNYPRVSDFASLMRC